MGNGNQCLNHPNFAQRQPAQSCGRWGSYDACQIERECTRRGIENPLTGLVHANLKATFAKQRQIKQVEMLTALQSVDLPLDGLYHYALNIAKLLPQLLSFTAQR